MSPFSRKKLYGGEYEYKHGQCNKYIDAVLYRGTAHESASPSNIEVAIEHENNPGSIENELSSFSKHSFSLNVIITYPPIMTDVADYSWLIRGRNREDILNQITGQILFSGH
jgi:hypothetical protein